jgi:hypothetical protein
MIIFGQFVSYSDLIVEILGGISGLLAIYLLILFLYSF